MSELSAFNSTFEFCHRALLILANATRPLSARQIAAADLMITYGAYFQIASSNLHGTNLFYKHEYVLRHTKIGQALRRLSMLGLVRPALNPDYGVVYELSGQDLPSYENLAYARCYQELAPRAIALVADLTDSELIGWECEPAQKACP